MTVKLLTEHHLAFLSLNGDCTGWYKSTLAKMLHCWKSHVAAYLTVEIHRKRQRACSIYKVSQESLTLKQGKILRHTAIRVIITWTGPFLDENGSSYGSPYKRVIRPCCKKPIRYDTSCESSNGR